MQTAHEVRYPSSDSNQAPQGMSPLAAYKPESPHYFHHNRFFQKPHDAVSTYQTLLHPPYTSHSSRFLMVKGY